MTARRILAAVAAFLLWHGGAWAACNPVTAPVGSQGCQPTATTFLPSDTLELWQPASFPASLNQLPLSTLFASPPPIGSTTPNSGAFTALSVSGTINGVNIIGGTLFGYGGNTFLGAEQNAVNFTGTESTFIGDRAGGNTVTGSFTTAVGHDVLGIGGGCSGITVSNNQDTAMGTDTVRNGCGIVGFVGFGGNILKNYTGNNNSGHAGFGISALGLNAMFNWNGGDYPWDTAVGSAACLGAVSGTINFSNGTCVGSNTGKALTTASNFLILAGGGNGLVGGATFASGSGVILIGSAAQTVDTPLPGTSNYINIENVLTFTGTNAPSTSIGTFAGNAVVIGGLTAGTVNGATLSGGSLATYGGNLFLGSEQNAASFAGTESTFIGDRAGGHVGTGNFSTVTGHDAAGIGGGCTNIYLSSATVTGADAMRNTCGSNQVTAYGAGALKNFSQAGTSANQYPSAEGRLAG